MTIEQLINKLNKFPKDKTVDIALTGQAFEISDVNEFPVDNDGDIYGEVPDEIETEKRVFISIWK